MLQNMASWVDHITTHCYLIAAFLTAIIGAKVVIIIYIVRKNSSPSGLTAMPKLAKLAKKVLAMWRNTH